MEPEQENSVTIPRRISDFIKEHHVLTLAVSGKEGVWCSHAFYAYVPEEGLFIITSEEKTKHIRIVEEDPERIVAGAIALETKNVGLIRGLQFKGEIYRCSSSVLNSYRLTYLRRFPYAVLTSGEIWIIRITEAKYTDNRLGFGKKLLWSR